MIYFIEEQARGFIKIGTAVDPRKRMVELQVASAHELLLLGTILGGPDHEADLHRQFAVHRIRGEWFRGGMDGILPEVHGLIGEWIEPTTFLRDDRSLAWEVKRRRNDRSGLVGVRVAVRGRSGLWIVESSRWWEGERLQVNVVGLETFHAHRREAMDQLINHPLGDIPASEIKARAGNWIDADLVFLIGSWPLPVEGMRKRKKRVPQNKGSFWHTANCSFDKGERRNYNDWRARLGLAWFSLADALEIVRIGPWSEEDTEMGIYEKLTRMKKIINESPDIMTE